MKYNIDLIKQSVNLLDLVEQYGITVRKKMCRCPFHGEKHPSMKIYEDNSYYCFACGAHGDVISWVQNMDGLNFPQAVEKLANMAGIMPEEEKPRKPFNPEKMAIERLKALKEAQSEVRRLQPKTMDEQPSQAFLNALKRRNELCLLYIK